MPSQPLSFGATPAELLTHPTSPLPLSTFRFFPSSRSFPSFPSFPLPFSIPPPRTLGPLCDLLATLLLLHMLLRTATYLRRRAAGQAGPAAATALLKFWAVASALHVGAAAAHLYLAPLRAGWLVDALRLALLAPLCAGRRLRVAVAAFDRLLVPALDARAAEIEAGLADVAARGARVNDTLTELAKALLDRLAVGGVAALANIPAELADEARQQQQRQLQRGQPPSQPQHEQSGEHARAAGEGGGPALTSLDALPLEAPRSRFRSGGPDERADVARRAAIPPAIAATVEVAVAEAPRPAFEESRAMRQRFRERLQRRNSKLVPG